jgi:hypothetical protein
MVALSAAPAAAVPSGWLIAPGGANSSGTGFCLSQLAQDPEGTAGASSLGEVVRAVAPSGAVPGVLNDVRYPVCGGPGAGE